MGGRSGLLAEPCLMDDNGGYPLCRVSNFPTLSRCRCRSCHCNSLRRSPLLVPVTGIVSRYCRRKQAGRNCWRHTKYRQGSGKNSSFGNLLYNRRLYSFLQNMYGIATDARRACAVNRKEARMISSLYMI